MNKYGKWIGNELKYLKQALNGEAFVGRFESEFSKVFGINYAIAHNSGTSTLHSCLAAAGVGEGDEVISPAQTVIMNSFVILYQNATPVYADIDPDTFNINPKDIEEKMSDNTKAIIAVHMHGLPADMDPIMKIAKKHNICVIEDSAQCVLGKYRGRLAGTIGNMASFSFETKKHISTGEGGMVITDDADLAVRVRKAGGLGYKNLKAGQSLTKVLPSEFQDPDYKRHDTLGLNYRMNEFTAAVGLAQLERIYFLVERRIACAELFLKAIEDCDWILPQKVPDGVENTYWTFTVRYERDDWKAFYNKFKENGGNGFYGGLSVAYEEPVMKNYNYIGWCPIAEEIQPKMMQFKTNYRNMEIAKEQAQILKKTIGDME